MRISGFTIKNFKGIETADIRFAEHDTARIHTLVGLNESGKTTLLEAIHSFSPDVDTEVVVEGVRSRDQQREQWVPRDQFSIFTGEVSVTAHVIAEEGDWDEICTKVLSDLGVILQKEELPDEYKITLSQLYKNGDYIRSRRRYEGVILRTKSKSKRAKIFRDASESQKKSILGYIFNLIPTIAYYTTFVFDFPDRVYLTNKERSPKNEFYCRLFQDILDYTGAGYTIEESIISRLHREEDRNFWDAWFTAFSGNSEEAKIKQVVARAERAVTDVVFSKWEAVFGETAGNKKVQINLNYEQGAPISREDGTKEPATMHDAYIQFRILDGADPYDVEHRSLGFRWFFCFLLFTQFRLHRHNARPTIFLFDEPASNLHAAAQIKLLESFPEIAKHPHRLIYSTHSHYMVEPKWLEQAYIVYNNKVDPEGSIIDSTLSDQADIRAVPYRAFVNHNPTKTSYFQPVIDTLKVVPSKFDYDRGVLMVEGKK